MLVEASLLELFWDQTWCFSWKNIVKGFSMKTTTLISKKMSSVALLFTHWTYSQENFFQGSLDSTLNGRRGQDLRPPRCALKTQEVPPPPTSQEVGGAFSSLSNEVVDVPKVVETTEQVKKAIDPHEQEVTWRKKSLVVIMGNKFVYTKVHRNTYHLLFTR